MKYMKNILICFMLLFMFTGCNTKDSNVLVTEKNGEKTSKIEQAFTLETEDITTSELATSVPTETEPIITTAEKGVSNKSNYDNREGVVVTKEQALTRISTISFNNVVEENLNKFFFLLLRSTAYNLSRAVYISKIPLNIEKKSIYINTVKQDIQFLFLFFRISADISES